MQYKDIEAGINLLADVAHDHKEITMINLLVHHLPNGDASAEIRCENAKVVDVCGLVVEVCRTQGIDVEQFIIELRKAEKIFDKHIRKREIVKHQ